MLSVSKISKKFNGKSVLEEVSFSITKGEIVGLVGPNGSGKTTLLNILMGMLKATTGTYQIASGVTVGMSVSRKGFFNDMSVNKNVFIYARLMSADKECVDRVLNEFKIDFGKLRFGQLSAGMKQRLSLLIPFLTDNHLILLDEPSNHLDIDSILTLRNKIMEQRKLETSFLITSHIFSDLEKVCDRILFLKAGKLYADRKTSDLIEEYGTLEEAYLEIK